ncbi:MAG: Fe2+-dependent dioxygenase [Thermosynechococcaceae cyanobacterium]
MLLTIDDLLTAEELAFINPLLNQAEFVDGKLTAGWHAQLVKHNAQLPADHPQGGDLRHLVRSALNRHPLFQAAVQPMAIHTILFSRYDVGMSYGLHVDNALMGGNLDLDTDSATKRYRSDVSWTLFLNDSTDYEGGALAIEGNEGVQSFKLKAGAAVLYPSSFLHQVEPVTAGMRLVAVGWVQSLIRDPVQRAILFDLDAARRSLFRQYGKTPEFDLISKTHANLLRQWSEF